MKTAEELFEKHATRYLDAHSLDASDLQDALTEHDAELIAKIKGMIEERKRDKVGVSNCRVVAELDSEIKALTELLKELE